MDLRRLKNIDPVPAALALAALFLSLYNIEKSGYLNAYYTAAVTSMTQSLHNFFYNSFDPGGFISIDKPPVAFWLQAISVKLLGLHSWSLALPSALAFAGSVILLYLTVRPSFGRTAARLAALILTFTPIAAAVSRTNNVDSVLVFFLMLAVHVLTRAVRTDSLGQLCLAFALVGVGFNTKMMQAYLVLPALYLFVLAARRLPWQRTLKRLAAATAVLALVSLSWAAAVDTTPEARRPYVGSSLHNSVLELALGYNGIGRLTGNLSGSVSLSPEAAKIAGQEASLIPALPGGLDGRLKSEEKSSDAFSADDKASERPARGFAPASSAGTMSSVGEDGPPGPLRLLDAKLAGQITWLLPFALLGAVMLWFRRPERRPEILLWTVWLLPMIVVFSMAGYFHRYYLIMLAPGIAALSGAALAELMRSPRLAWLLPGWAVAFGTAAYIAFDDELPRIALTVAALGVLALLPALAPLRRRLKGRFALKAAFACGLAALMAAPIYWSLTPALYGVSARQPYASPHLAEGGGSWSRDGEPLNGALVDYLLRHQGNAKYIAAMPSSNSGADALIIQTGKPVLAWGGFKGVDPALDIQGLRDKVRKDEVRYALLSETHVSNNPLARWIQENAAPVPESAWNAMRGSDRPAGRMTDENASPSSSITGAIGRVADALGLEHSYQLYDMKKEE
ncbi:glycosyltransferase family 39 protein [Saccharibacillus alkalitolerans]|uniref:Glycosyltransferase family 39 protein n=1 Tax=Saccharibacillus alkalitolerans TaxID=2705290 RepID=A0ABX0FDL2_9BACL|nr:glycosyltransferase family 39 protein [Saccharibacillus alkalitolerans]NGZ77849.1 glycosyltransferase family 39 protein [Saccharibacillus alkalitolerans]